MGAPRRGVHVARDAAGAGPAVGLVWETSQTMRKTGRTMTTTWDLKRHLR